MEGIYNMDLLGEKIHAEKGILVYFSTESCSVCKVLKPKVSQLLIEKFPHMVSYYVDIDNSSLIAGQFRVFTIPTILLFFDGKEHLRFSRNISLYQLEEAIKRPYGLVFEE